jgi:hypothetical protein
MSGNTPAFPRIGFSSSEGNYIMGQQGMTMRQFYKAQALANIPLKTMDRYSINDIERGEPRKDAAEVARVCGVYADAMIAEDEAHTKK